MTFAESLPKGLLSRKPFALWTKLKSQECLSWKWHLAIFLLCAVALASRRVSLIHYPAFYAEDGVAWFADAYSLGWWRPLLSPSGGYLNTLPRLVASLAQLVPFVFAPLFMNLVGLVVQVLPVNALLLKQSIVWGRLPVRLLLAIVYLALPNVAEIHIVITNAHFHLAVLAFLLIVAEPPRTRLAQTLEMMVLALSGLTDPFCFPLLLIASGVWLMRRGRWSFTVAAIEAACAIVQGLALAFGAGRAAVHLGASPHRFIQILAGQVYTSALLGAGVGPTLPYWALVTLFIVCTALVLYCFFKGPVAWKLFIALSSMLFLSAIIRPLGGPGSVWIGLTLGAGPRYWFFPMLAFAWSLVWCATRSPNRVVQIVGILGLLVTIDGVVNDWHLPEFPDKHFADSAHQLATAREGDLVTIPILPDLWSIRLVKKGVDCRYPPLSGLTPPPPPANVDQSFTVAGWLASAVPISGVAISIDGKVVKTNRLFTVLASLDRIQPLAVNKDKGWATQVDVSRLGSGPHDAVVRAVAEQGCRSELGSFQIMKVTPASAHLLR